MSGFTRNCVVTLAFNKGEEWIADAIDAESKRCGEKVSVVIKALLVESLEPRGFTKP